MFSRTLKRSFAPNVSRPAILESLESRLLMSVDLAPTVDFNAQTFPDGLVAGASGTINLTLTNQGTTTAKGVIQSDFYFSTDNTLDGNAVLAAGNVKTHVNIKAGRTVTYKISVPVPKLAKGQYYVIADVNTTGSIVETDTANNVVASADTEQVTYIFGSYRGKRLTLTLTDTSSGSDVNVSFSSTNKGYGIVADDSTPQSVGYAISTQGANSRTDVNIRTDSGQYTEIQSLDIPSGLDAFNAGYANLIGDVNVNGPMARLVLADVGVEGGADNTQINLNGYCGPWLDLSFNRVVNTSLSTNQAVNDLTATEWIDDGGAKDTIHAPAIDELHIVGDSKVTGDFQADVNVWSDDDSYYRAEIDELQVTGTVSGVTVRADRNIHNVTVGASIDSNFLAGIEDGVIQPQSRSDFFTGWYGNWHHQDEEAYGAIDYFTVTGLANDANGTFFQNTNISAGSVGTVSLQNVAYDNSGTRFGIFAARYNTWGNPVYKTSLYDTAANTTTTLYPDDYPYTDQDFAIRIVW